MSSDWAWSAGPAGVNVSGKATRTYLKLALLPKAAAELLMRPQIAAYACMHTVYLYAAADGPGMLVSNLRQHSVEVPEGSFWQEFFGWGKTRG